jgi:MFS transporter, TsgA protein
LNRARITLTSFLAYAVMAGMLSQIGIMINPMGEHYGKEATEVASQFSWLTFGILGGSLISLVIFDFIKIKHLTIIVPGCIIVSIAGFYLLDSFEANRLFLGIIGVGCGIALPAAAIVIARSYGPRHRATMLVITDAFFSLSGALCTTLAIIYFSMDLHWSAGFGTVAILALIGISIATISDYPEVEPEEKTNLLLELKNWPLSIYLCMAALFLYLIGQNFILIWIPSYAETIPGVSPEQAGQLVSNYWTGMFVGQLVVVALLTKFKTVTLTIFASVLMLFSVLPLWLIGEIGILTTLTFVWGLVTLGLLKLILSWATEMVNVPGPHLISALLMAATMGTAVSPALSSQLVEISNTQAPIQAGSIAFLIVLVLVVSARFILSKAEGARKERARTKQ